MGLEQKCDFYGTCPVKRTGNCKYIFNKINCPVYREGFKLYFVTRIKFIKAIRAYEQKIRC